MNIPNMGGNGIWVILRTNILRRYENMDTLRIIVRVFTSGNWKTHYFDGTVTSWF